LDVVRGPWTVTGFGVLLGYFLRLFFGGVRWDKWSVVCWFHFLLLLFFFLGAPNLDVGLLTVVAGVGCEANVQPTHSHVISCSPTPPNASLKRDGKTLIDLVDGLSLRTVVLVSVTNDNLCES
jgi:hypothetical protein